MRAKRRDCPPARARELYLSLLLYLHFLQAARAPSVATARPLTSLAPLLACSTTPPSPTPPQWVAALAAALAPASPGPGATFAAAPSSSSAAFRVGSGPAGAAGDACCCDATGRAFGLALDVPLGAESFELAEGAGGVAPEAAAAAAEAAAAAASAASKRARKDRGADAAEAGALAHAQALARALARAQARYEGVVLSFALRPLPARL